MKRELHDQVMVITGASSGIGRSTARLAAARRARLVLAARNAEALRHIGAQVEESGAEVLMVETDVSKREDIEQLGTLAMERFGQIDTWVNNAGVSMFGLLEEISIEDHRRLFETNYWGVVYGSLEAVKLMRSRGGTIINIGSTVSDRALPLQGAYCASKHAVKGFTDALRMELRHEGVPISVSLIKPGSIDTPYPDHAKNYLSVQPKLPAPLYSPDAVARAILHCAATPERDVFVGAGGKLLSTLGTLAPSLMDSVMESFMFRQQQSNEPAKRTGDGLHGPSQEFGERGPQRPAFVQEHSIYTGASLHPLLTGAAAIAATVAVGALLKRRGGSMPHADRLH